MCWGFQFVLHQTGFDAFLGLKHDMACLEPDLVDQKMESQRVLEKENPMYKALDVSALPEYDALGRTYWHSEDIDFLLLEPKHGFRTGGAEPDGWRDARSVFVPLCVDDRVVFRQLPVWHQTVTQLRSLALFQV